MTNEERNNTYEMRWFEMAFPVTGNHPNMTRGRRLNSIISSLGRPLPWQPCRITPGMETITIILLRRYLKRISGLELFRRLPVSHYWEGDCFAC